MSYDIGFYYRKYFPDSTPEYTRMYGTRFTVEHISFHDVVHWQGWGYLQRASNQKYRVWTTYPLIVDNPENTPDIVSIYSSPSRVAFWWLGDGVETTYNTKRLRPFTLRNGAQGSNNPPSAFDPLRVTYSHRAISAIGQKTQDGIHYSTLPDSVDTVDNRNYLDINPVFLQYLPVGGYSKYEFKIYDNDTVVYSNIETERPVLNIKSACPTNTCPVDCGTHLCCYGSDGIAVSYYEK